LAAAHRRWAAELLYVWFHKLGPRVWFTPDPRADALLRRRFARELTNLRARAAREFLADPLTALAAVLLFDQAPRNLYRGNARAYAFDKLARTIAREALRRGFDRALEPWQRQFLAMPLMHSESIADQRASLAIYNRLGAAYGRPFAVSHHRMIARFGRFPHRNGMLGRTSSAAEKRAVAAGYHW
jgi:uncharacterized protein (DUF924 family)